MPFAFSQIPPGTLTNSQYSDSLLGLQHRPWSIFPKAQLIRSPLLEKSRLLVAQCLVRNRAAVAKLDERPFSGWSEKLLLKCYFNPSARLFRSSLSFFWVRLCGSVDPLLLEVAPAPNMWSQLLLPVFSTTWGWDQMGLAVSQHHNPAFSGVLDCSELPGRFCSFPLGRSFEKERSSPA